MNEYILCLPAVNFFSQKLSTLRYICVPLVFTDFRMCLKRMLPQYIFVSWNDPIHSPHYLHVLIWLIIRDRDIWNVCWSVRKIYLCSRVWTNENFTHTVIEYSNVWSWLIPIAYSFLLLVHWIICLWINLIWWMVMFQSECKHFVCNLSVAFCSD